MRKEDTMTEDSVPDSLLSPHPMDISPLSQHDRDCSLKEESRAKEKSIFQPFCQLPVQAHSLQLCPGLTLPSQSPFLMVLRLVLLVHSTCGCTVTCEKPPADSNISASPLSSLLEQGHLHSRPTLQWQQKTLFWSTPPKFSVFPRL